jgi:uncharacterized protein (TIGR02996 family)
MVFIDIIGPGGSRTVSFPIAELTIGSARDADLQLDHAEVAAHHATVIERGGYPVILDLGRPSTGTFVNGRPIGSEPAVLADGCEVSIGPFRLRFRDVDLPPDTVQPDTLPTETMRRPSALPDTAVESVEIIPEMPVSSGSVDVDVELGEPPMSHEPESEARLTEPHGVRSLLRATDDPIELAFLKAVLEDADEALARSVYADWLEERGDATRAEYMRLLERLRPGADPDDREPARLRLLGARIASPWRALVAPRWMRIERCPTELLLQTFGSDRPSDCPRAWGSLPRWTVDELRHCKTCLRFVHYFSDLDAAKRAAARGEPLAIDPAVRRSPSDLE